ncbi:hypothetical protein [Lacrimispora sp.]|uniref:hypothetical protein n=1 Tax=Lacrimispora sp. TaxID=2719234 RepID=UPI0032E3A92B
MGQYNKAVLTTAGENLIARALAGEIELKITKAKTSSYTYPSGTDFKSLTDMKEINQAMENPTNTVYNDTIIQTRVLFSNEEITSTYYIHNIGLYVMDGTQEVLFCIVTADIPDEMPQYNGVATTSYIYNIQNVVQNATELNITVNPSGTATIQDVSERVDATGGDISETVIETLDTIEDKFPVPGAGESVKRFLGKVLTFLKNIRPLTSDITFYVSKYTGSDTFGNGSSSSPFKTIQYAINAIPKTLNGYKASIHILSGTYNEDVLISGFGTVGYVELVLPGDVTINNFIINNSAVVVTSSTGAMRSFVINSLSVRGCSNFNAWATINTTTTGMYSDTILGNDYSMGFGQGSTVYMSGTTTITGNTKNGLLMHSLARAYFNVLTGSGLSVGIMISTNAQLAYYNESISAVTHIQQATGGMIFNRSGTQISNIISSGLSCVWGTISGGYRRIGNMTGYAQIVVNTRVTITQAMTAGNVYTVTGFPPIVDGAVYISCAVDDYYRTRTCYLTNSGANAMIYFIPLINLSAGWTMNFSTTYTTSS